MTSYQRFFISLLLLAATGWSVLFGLRFLTAKPLFPLRGEYARVNETRLYFNQWGTGKVVLFLHGFPYHSDTYYACLSRPLPGYKFMSLDLPGMGYSEKQLNKPLSPEDLAFMVKTFLDKLNIHEVVLVGHDLGGGVAMILAAQYPMLVTRMVLLAPDSSAGQAGASLPVWWRWPLVGEAGAVVFLDRGQVRRMLKQAWSPSNTRWIERVEQYALPLDTPDGRWAFLKMNQGRYPFDYRPYEERLHVPTLLIFGKDDQVLPAGVGLELSKNLEAMRLELIPDVGHIPQEEAPEKVYQLIRDFLLSTPPALNRN